MKYFIISGGNARELLEDSLSVRPSIKILLAVFLPIREFLACWPFLSFHFLIYLYFCNCHPCNIIMSMFNMNYN